MLKGSALSGGAPERGHDLLGRAAAAQQRRAPTPTREDRNSTPEELLTGPAKARNAPSCPCPAPRTRQRFVCLSAAV